MGFASSHPRRLPHRTTETMKSTIIDKQKWMYYCGIAGMTASEWLSQILGYKRKSDFTHNDVMDNLRIGGWSHSYHYKGNFGISNTEQSYQVLSEEVARLANELDMRIGQLTAIENHLLGLEE